MVSTNDLHFPKKGTHHAYGISFNWRRFSCCGWRSVLFLPSPPQSSRTAAFSLTKIRQAKLQPNERRLVGPTLVLVKLFPLCRTACNVWLRASGAWSPPTPKPPFGLGPAWPSTWSECATSLDSAYRQRSDEHIVTSLSD